MNDVLYQLCLHCVSIMNGCHPFPSGYIAEELNLPFSKVVYRLRKLKRDGYVKSFYEGGRDEDGNVYCLHGWGITEKTKNTEEYKKAWEKEKAICKKCFDMDIGELK